MLTRRRDKKLSGGATSLVEVKVVGRSHKPQTHVISPDLPLNLLGNLVNRLPIGRLGIALGVASDPHPVPAAHARPGTLVLGRHSAVAGVHRRVRVIKCGPPHVVMCCYHLFAIRFSQKQSLTQSLTHRKKIRVRGLKDNGIRSYLMNIYIESDKNITHVETTRWRPIMYQLRSTYGGSELIR
eukprot:990174-Prorocentrum_minimum.AAC.1